MQRQCGVLLLNRRTPTAGPTIGSVSEVLYAVSRCLAFIPIVSEVPSNQELSALGLATAHPGSPDKRCQSVRQRWTFDALSRLR